RTTWCAGPRRSSHDLRSVSATKPSCVVAMRSKPSSSHVCGSRRAADMFDSLTDRLTAALRRFSGHGKLSKEDVEVGLREVRVALLEADVNFRVARAFVDRIRERAVGSEVLESLTPGQQIVKIVDEELRALLGGELRRLRYQAQPPTVVMLVGLQGSGKTTTAAKLALAVRREGHRPLLVAADVQRPAAVLQLEKLGRDNDIPVA